MSHTSSTDPMRVQPRELVESFRFGGVWTGVKEVRRRYNRQDRADARRALRRGDEPEPRQGRHRAQWDMY